MKTGPATLSQSTNISDDGKSGCGQRELICGYIFSLLKEQSNAIGIHCQTLEGCLGLWDEVKGFWTLESGRPDLLPEL